MAEILSTGVAILISGLALLGMAFILSRGFPWLRADRRGIVRSSSASPSAR